MVKLAFVVPCHGREAMTRLCMRQLARTCESLELADVDATAVLVGDEAWIPALAGGLGFSMVRAANRPLGRKWNDGYEHAARELGADYLVPLGSDDIVDWRAIAANLPVGDAVGAFRLCTLVSPDGLRLRPLEIKYDGGDGIRIFPRLFMERLGFRPALDQRDRALDTSIVLRTIEATGRKPRFVYRDRHQLQIVGLKSSYGQEEQLNGYDECADHGAAEVEGALPLLAEHYPDELISELRAFYAARVGVPA